MVMPEHNFSRFSNRTHPMEDLSDLNLNKVLYNQEHKTSKQVYEPFLEVIADLVSKGKYRKILDFGCGTGLVGHFLRESFDADKIKLTGIDISEVALERSKPFYDHLYMKDDCTLPEDQYDLVVLNSVLEHIYDSNLKILFSEIKNKTFTQWHSFYSRTKHNNFPHLKFLSQSIQHRQNGFRVRPCQPENKKRMEAFH